MCEPLPLRTKFSYKRFEITYSRDLLPYVSGLFLGWSGFSDRHLQITKKSMSYLVIYW